MSFLVRSRPSQKWDGAGSAQPGASFSVRTGKRFSGDSDSYVGPKGSSSVREALGAPHFLRNEAQAARAAVEALDSYTLKLASFQDKAMELVEEAHRALSRLEHAVALAAAPELIVVACEIKVACRRGLHLFRTYGRYRYLGKLIALATRSSITAKYDAVIARLTAIMPLGRAPSFSSTRPPLSQATASGDVAGAAAAAAGKALAEAGAQGGSVGLQQQLLGSAGSSQQHASTPEAASQEQRQHSQQLTQRHTQSSTGQAGCAAGAALAARLKGGNLRASTDAAGGGAAVLQQPGGDNAVLSVVLCSNESAKVNCITFADVLGPCTCIWWAADDVLEFYSMATQSTTSFAPLPEKAAITAVAADSAGNIWCANAKGSVLMRQQRNWEQVFVERAFSSCVRCLAPDADSDVVWGGDEAGRLAVFRVVEVGGVCKLECTATILPGRAGAGVKASNTSALLDVKPKALSRWRAVSCRALKDQKAVAEGPIRAMLVRDDRAWVAGGRGDPWIGLFDAVLGTQLDMWPCGAYGGCCAMASLLTSDARAERAEATAAAAAAAAAAGSRFTRTQSSSDYGGLAGGLDVPDSVPEDHVGEDPRSGWRLVTGHDNGQLLLWNAASDHLQPLVRVGDPGHSPVKAIAVLEEQGLLAVVHANGELVLFLRPAKDRDWLMGPSTPAAAGTAAAAFDGSRDSSGAGAHTVAGAGAHQQQPHMAPQAAAAAAGVSGAAGPAAAHEAQQQQGSAAAAATAPEHAKARCAASSSSGAPTGLATIKPRRVVLRSHRTLLVAAAACSSGVVTASASGCIKLWPAEGLAKEAERCGLLVQQAARDNSLATARSSLTSGRLQQQAMTYQASDSLVSNAHSPLEQQTHSASSLNGLTAAATGAGGVVADRASLAAAAAAAAAAGAAAFAAPADSSQQQSSAGSCPLPSKFEQQRLFVPEQQQQEREGTQLAWQQQQQQQRHQSLHQQSLQLQDSMANPHVQLYAGGPYPHPHPHPHLQQQPDSLLGPSLARLSEPGVYGMQQPLLQQQQQALFFASSTGAAAHHSEALGDELVNPLLVQQQQRQVSLERRSAPLDIPWQQTGMFPPPPPLPGSAAAAAGGVGPSSRGGSMGAPLMYSPRRSARETHPLGYVGSSPRYSSGGALMMPESIGAGGSVQSVGSSLLAPPSTAGSMGAAMQGAYGGYGYGYGAAAASGGPDVGSGDGRYVSPRAPKALRERGEQGGMNRERRRSERRLSKGANIAWSTCQIIDASELRLMECIGGGAYGQVFCAEWMGTQVAAKQLLSFKDKAKDAVTKRKAAAAAAQQDAARHADSDTDSDTDSVDSVEEEVAAELKQLMDEVWVLGSLSHPSITRFCALVLDPPMIVMQYYPHGSLFDLLKRGRRSEKRALHELSWTKRLDMLRDIASGMVFLHSRKPPIVHGDLRSPNLLLDLTIDRDRPRFHVKIADFGLARMVGPTSSIAVSKVTNPRWSAPEVLRDSVVSLSADVYSFAVVMWELLTWQQPFEDMMSVQVLFSVMQSFRPEIPPEDSLPGQPGATLPRYIALMERCWSEDEAARPTFEEVLQELDELRSCEIGLARSRAGDSSRSLHGGSTLSAPGTPTGSMHGGSSGGTTSRGPCSTTSSAPNSGRESAAGIGVSLAAAAAAGAAAAAAAAADRRRQQSMDDGSSAREDPSQQQQQQPLWGGAGGGLQPINTTAPPGAASNSSSPRQQQQQGGGSPGPFGGSEPSFTLRAAPVMPPGGAVGGGPVTGAVGGGVACAAAVARTPSRLGPTRCGSAGNSPRMPGGPQQQQQQLQVAPQAPGSSRLRRRSWGTLDGPLQSSGSDGSGSGRLSSPKAHQTADGAFAQDMHTPRGAPPEQEHKRTLGAPSAAAVAAAAAAVTGRLHSPFSAMQQQQQQLPELAEGTTPAAAASATGGRSVSPFSAVQLPAATAAGAGVAAVARTPFSPFSAVQQQPETAGDAAAAAPAAAAATGVQPPPVRPHSPFAAVQAAGGAPGYIQQQKQQQQHPQGFAVEHYSARQTSADSVDYNSSDWAAIAAAQAPAARPCTPTGTAEEGDFEVIGIAAAPRQPYRDLMQQQQQQQQQQQEQQQRQGSQAAMTAAAAAAAAAAPAKPWSPFAAAQQQQQQPPGPPPQTPTSPNGSSQQQQGEEEEGRESPVVVSEELAGSPFLAVDPNFLEPGTSSGSFAWSGPVTASGGAHNNSSKQRVGRMAAANAAAAAPKGTAASSSQQQQQGGAQAALQQQGSTQQQQQQQGAWGRPPSPFAAMNAAAVQGPIVARQARAALSAAMPGGPHAASGSSISSLDQAEALLLQVQQQQQQGQQAQQQRSPPAGGSWLRAPAAAAAGPAATGPSAAAPSAAAAAPEDVLVQLPSAERGSGGSGGSGLPGPTGSAASDSSARGFTPLQSFVFSDRAAQQQQQQQQQPPGATGMHSATAAAAAGGGGSGGVGAQGAGVRGQQDLAATGGLGSGDSITFPSGLAAVESVVFMRGSPAKQQR